MPGAEIEVISTTRRDAAMQQLRLTLPVPPAMRYRQMRRRQCQQLRLTLPVPPAMWYHQMRCCQCQAAETDLACTSQQCGTIR